MSNKATENGRRPTRRIAKLSELKPEPNENGSHVCILTCTCCYVERPITLGGWVAIACFHCGTELYRNKTALALAEYEARHDQSKPKITE